MSILFSKTIVKDRIKQMDSLPRFEWESDDEEILDTQQSGSIGLSTAEIMEDAISGLQTLGYKKSTCAKYAKSAISNGAKSVQEIVTFALKAAQLENRCIQQ